MSGPNFLLFSFFIAELDEIGWLLGVLQPCASDKRGKIGNNIREI